ncbi:hypothetical protein CR513_27081, partial [Mucuna pruriens]
IKGKGCHKEHGSKRSSLDTHLYILNNIEEVLPYLSTYQDILKKKNPQINEKWINNENNKSFLNWFKGQNLNEDTKQDNKSTMQNNGVMVMVESMHLSTKKDKNPIMASICYFGCLSLNVSELIATQVYKLMNYLGRPRQGWL